MTWSYSGDPGASLRDAVRFLIGDTDGTRQLLGDDEIDWLASTQGSQYVAAAFGCEMIADKISGSASSKSVGDLSIDFGGTAEFWANKSKLLRRRGALCASPYAGGLSQARKDSFAQETDLTQPEFYKGQFDHPESDADTRDVTRRSG